jgi:hypothetical protein
MSLVWSLLGKAWRFGALVLAVAFALLIVDVYSNFTLNLKVLEGGGAK